MKAAMVMVIALMLAVQLAAAGELVHTLSFDGRDLNFGTRGGYDIIDLQGCPA